MQDMHSRNPTFLGDWGPPTEVQPRLTGISQTGRLVVIDNPISYVVEPGRYYPFLSLRGHTDPMSQDLGNRLRLGDVMGEDLPNNQEPKHVQGGFFRSMSWFGTRGAVREGRGKLANTSFLGTGPEGLPLPEQQETHNFWSGMPHDLGLDGI